MNNQYYQAKHRSHLIGWTHGSFWHTDVSHPASIVIHAHVTEDVRHPTHGGLRGVAGWGAHRALGHAVVPIPAWARHAHVTQHVRRRGADRGGHLGTLSLGQSSGCKREEERGEHHLSESEEVYAVCLIIIFLSL